MTSSAAHEMDRLRALVLADGALQQRLRAVADTAQFIERTAEAARTHGVDLDAADLRDQLQNRPLTSGAQSPQVNGLPPQKGWLPIGLSQAGGQPSVDWAYFGEQRLTEPFFEASRLRALYQPFNLLFRFCTPLADLARWSQGLAGLPPSGFIFHMSRCGSTLAAQMLARSPSNIVVSEASPVDAVVRIDPVVTGHDAAAHAALLAAMVGVFGQARAGGESRYFIKLDCWHAMALPLFRRAFPTTPWVFLYREPAEVMVSQMRQRGAQMVPDLVPPRLFGLDLPGGVPTPDYCARVLGAICEAALRAYPEGGGLLVNYRQLPQALWTTILPHFGVACSDAEREAMAGAARYDAKAPEIEFSPDSDAKRRAATQAVAMAAERHVGEAYRRLEAL